MAVLAWVIVALLFGCYIIASRTGNKGNVLLFLIVIWFQCSEVPARIVQLLRSYYGGSLELKVHSINVSRLGNSPRRILKMGSENWVWNASYSTVGEIIAQLFLVIVVFEVYQWYTRFKLANLKKATVMSVRNFPDSKIKLRVKTVILRNGRGVCQVNQFEGGRLIDEADFGRIIWKIRGFRHPFVQKLQGSSYEPGVYCLIYPFNGTLWLDSVRLGSQLEEADGQLGAGALEVSQFNGGNQGIVPEANGPVLLCFSQRLITALRIGEGLRYLHSKALYGSLKKDRILIGRKMNPIIVGHELQLFKGKPSATGVANDIAEYIEIAKWLLTSNTDSEGFISSEPSETKADLEGGIALERSEMNTDLEGGIPSERSEIIAFLDGLKEVQVSQLKASDKRFKDGLAKLHEFYQREYPSSTWDKFSSSIFSRFY